MSINYLYCMRENPYQKFKVHSFKNIEKRESQEHKEKYMECPVKINLKTASIQELRNQATQLKQRSIQQQQELMGSEKMYRIEAFKNQNYKTEVNAFEKKSESVRAALAQRLIEQYKDNKDSPLFYNQTGLSPFQMLLLHYSRNESYSENICMICYMDIEMNSHIVELPCSHILHRDCAVQHLLYSKNCPGCSQQIFFKVPAQKFSKQ